MRRLDWGEIVRLRDAEGLEFAEIARRMGKYTASIQKAYEGAKRKGWTSAGPPDGEEVEDTERNTSAIREVIPMVGGLNEQEITGLREILAWWRDRGRNTFAIREVIRESPKSRRTYWIEDALHGALGDRARHEGWAMADLVNEAIRRYLQGHRGDAGAR